MSGEQLQNSAIAAIKVRYRPVGAKLLQVCHNSQRSGTPLTRRWAWRHCQRNLGAQKNTAESATFGDNPKQVNFWPCRSCGLPVRAGAQVWEFTSAFGDVG